MKRRLALLLALSLTFAAFPVTGAAATEADQTVVEQTVEETTENNEVETEAAAENEEADTAKSGEEATEAASAVETAEVFKENAREFTLIKSSRFGTILQMEVGALMVGRICNYHQRGCVERGQEKGRFEFGGSTVILLIQRDRIQIREDLLENTSRECETEVHMGECIGYSLE